MDNEGEHFPQTMFDAVRDELTRRFGGVTAYGRAPAQGTFTSQPGTVVSDDIVVFEVMVESLDRGFWTGYRDELTRAFSQDELVVRALAMERL